MIGVRLTGRVLCAQYDQVLAGVHRRFEAAGGRLGGGVQMQRLAVPVLAPLRRQA